jgi:hypothetical protein
LIKKFILSYISPSLIFLEGLFSKLNTLQFKKRIDKPKLFPFHHSVILKVSISMSAVFEHRFLQKDKKYIELV